MAYVGNTPADKTLKLEKQQFTTSATTSYTLSHSVSDPQDIALFINNVRQNPHSSYTVSNTTLTLSAATASTDTMYCVFLGRAIGTVGIGAGSVTKDKVDFISDSSGSGVISKGDGSSIDGSIQLNCHVNSHGIKLKSPPHSAGQSYTLTFPQTAPSSGKFIQTDGSGNLSFASAGITEADQFRLTAQLQANADPISSNLERVDDATFSKIGTGMSLSSGVYTFPSTGLYLVGCHAEFQISQDIGAEVQTFVSSNSGSNYDIVAVAMGGKQGSNFAHFTSYSCTYVNVTDASTFRVKFKADGFASTDTRLRGDTGYNMTSFDFIRLGDSQ